MTLYYVIIVSALMLPGNTVLFRIRHGVWFWETDLS
jgi:hypothetical protein